MDRKKAIEQLEDLKNRGVVSPSGYKDFLVDVEQITPKIEIVDIEKPDNVWVRIKKAISGG